MGITGPQQVLCDEFDAMSEGVYLSITDTGNYFHKLFSLLSRP